MARSTDLNGPAADPDERRDDLALKRDEYALERGKREDKDIRMMRLTIFWLLVGVFVLALLGVTAFDWPAAGYILTAYLSAIAGNMMQVHLAAFFGMSRKPHDDSSS